MIVRQHFMAGDTVRYIPMGDKEYILEGKDSDLFPLSIKHVSLFTLDGRVNTNHTHPLLILIRRPEEKKKWYQVFYKCHNEEMPQNASCLYNSEDDFYTRGILKNRLEWIELKFVCER